MAVSILQLVGLGVLGLGVILHIVGTVTPAWMEADSYRLETGDEFEADFNRPIDVDIGLFSTSCVNDGCTILEHMNLENEWKRTVKALIPIGVVLSLLAGLLAVVAIVSRSRNPNPSHVSSVICLFLCLLAGVLIFIGVIIYGVKVFSSHTVITGDDYSITIKSSLGYSFALCITGGILIVLGGAMVSAVCLEKPNNNQTIGTTAAAQSPPMLYPSQAGGMVYQNQAGGMVYQPQAGGMVYQPQVAGMAYQPQAGGMAYQPQAGGMAYQPQAGGIAYQPQAGGMAYQPQPEGMVYQPQAVGMSHPSATIRRMMMQNTQQEQMQAPQKGKNDISK